MVAVQQEKLFIAVLNTADVATQPKRGIHCTEFGNKLINLASKFEKILGAKVSRFEGMSKGCKFTENQKNGNYRKAGIKIR